MITVFLRLIIIYFFTLVSVRFMGKRQVGEMQMSELVTALFLSELAVYPLNDIDIPLAHGIIPMISLIVIEVIISFLSIKVPFLKSLFDNKPSYLVYRGKPDIKELKKNRITIDELISQLRLAGTPDLNEVYYAILEPNGRLSVIPKAESKPLTPGDRNLCVTEKGIVHAVISDGIVNESVLKMIGRDYRWLEKQLKANKIKNENAVFLMTVNDALECSYIIKDS